MTVTPNTEQNTQRTGPRTQNKNRQDVSQTRMSASEMDCVLGVSLMMLVLVRM